MTTSDGVWLKDNPFHFSLPILLFQLTVIFVVSKLTHAVLRRLGQPLIISQIMAGIIVGPDMLSRNLKFQYLIYEPQSYEQLSIVGIFGCIMYFFVVGVKADLGLIPKVGKKAVAIALFCTLLPIVSVYITATALGQKIPPRFTDTQLLLRVTSQWCLTSYAVLSAVLTELNLLSSKLGRLAMSATLIADFLHLLAASCINTYVLSVKIGSPLRGLEALSCLAALVVIIMFVLRPLVLWIIRRTPEGALLDEASFVAVLLMALVCALLAGIIGYDVFTGPFFFGLVLPGGAPLGATLVERMDRMVMGLFLPVAIVQAGTRMRMLLLTDTLRWGLFELFLVICVVSKFLGVILPCLYCKMPHRDTVSLALMMTTKGIYEIVAAVQWQDDRILYDEEYTITLLTVLVFGGGTAPMVKYLYRPEDRYVAYKRRTLQHAKPGDELRVLACIHEQDNVNTALALLQASGHSHDSPIYVYVLHLHHLIGRTDAVLHPHTCRNEPSSSVALSESDHIVNAFRRFEQKHSDGVWVLPYICISPYNTMHYDVCSLALDKKVTLVILPFHKNVKADGSIIFLNPAVQSVNVNVLRYAPCSVAILVDHGISDCGFSDGGLLVHRVAVYFVGGPDDREALAYGVRMADHAAAELTVVRFLPPKEWRVEGREERIDDRVLMHFQRERVDGKRVVYREEVVKDGEATVAVIRKTSHQFSLLIVGRRQGEESPVTAGMSMWNEYPELGVIGDMLASTDFGGQASTLVVQQQQRVIRTQSTDDPESTRPRTRTRTPTPTPSPTGKRVVPRQADDY
ncbi:hypothetical protein MUK42_09124 [Musa troglodytarum]|uniref:Cation/H+ exchanger domain-containing protein n=1 Tax=Musa troglodytarum TaxID=320322 RepID=A0A9E7EDK7_9LILI|nr:hypothetical protein MUK42_09124 [Musa troglodytarum]